MAGLRVSQTEISKMIRDLARHSAREKGLVISDAAIDEILAPGKAYFAKRGGKITVSKKKLQDQVDELVNTAGQQIMQPTPPRANMDIRMDDRGPIRQPPSGDVMTYMLTGSPVYLNPTKQKSRRLGRTHIKRALKKSKCHYLWFC